MGQMVLMVSIGLAIGLAASLIANQAIRASLVRISLYDPLTIIGVIVVLFAVAVTAGYYPVRRASRVNPTVALRHE